METILLLHGAIGSAGQLRPLAGRLGAGFDVHCLDFSGHGGRPLTGAAFSMELFAGDVLRFMQEHGLDKVHIFGYSMGGYVGMYLAKHYPEKISKVITLATKFHWDEAAAARETKMLDPEKMEQKIPAFAAQLHDRHNPNDWKQVLQRTAEMMHGMGNNNPLTPNLEKSYVLVQ